MDLAYEIGANEVVIPDVLGDMHETLHLLGKFKPFMRPGFEYMGVVQGQTLEEAMYCINKMLASEMITCLGIPRVLANHLHREARVNVVEALCGLPDFPFDIHALGSSNWVKEVTVLADYPIRSMDSSMAINLGLLGIDIEDGYYEPRMDSFFSVRKDQIDDRRYARIANNVATFNRWAAGETSPIGTL